MKLLFLSATAIALALSAPAYAQEHHHGEHKGDHPPASHGAPPSTTNVTAPTMQKGPKPTMASPAYTPVTSATRSKPNGNAWKTLGEQAEQRKQQERLERAKDKGSHNNWQNNNNDNNNWRGGDHRGSDNDRHDNDHNDNDRHGSGHWTGSGGNDHDNNWSGRGRHGHDFSDFNRRNVHASHHYRWRGRSWHWPSGHSYRRWTFGMTLPSIFWANNYWIDDYYDYGLGAPPPGTVWVRYGNDAILIDRYTGEILEVVYDQFY
ncbi:MAG: RcnB family protein [Rhizomicrobium sp.]